MGFLSYFYPGVDVTLMIRGELASKGAVKILKGGTIIGSVIGHKISIEGQVQGTLTSSESLEIISEGSVEGNATAMSLLVESGSAYRGRCRIGHPPATPERENEEIDHAPETKSTPSRWFWQK